VCSIWWAMEAADLAAIIGVALRLPTALLLPLEDLSDAETSSLLDWRASLTHCAAALDTALAIVPQRHGRQNVQTEDCASDAWVGQKAADHLFLAEVLHRGEQQKKVVVGNLTLVCDELFARRMDGAALGAAPVPGQKSLLAEDLAGPVAKLARAAEFADWDAGSVRSEIREELQASLRLLDRVDHVTEADRHVQKLNGDKTERVVGGIRDVQRQLTSQWRSLQHQFRCVEQSEKNMFVERCRLRESRDILMRQAGDGGDDAVGAEPSGAGLRRVATECEDFLEQVGALHASLTQLDCH